jgi:hypothetical protein
VQSTATTREQKRNKAENRAEGKFEGLDHEQQIQGRALYLL